MAKAKTPSFIIDVELKGKNRDLLMIESELEINRVIYNTSLGRVFEERKTNEKDKTIQKISPYFKSHKVTSS